MSATALSGAHAHFRDDDAEFAGCSGLQQSLSISATSSRKSEATDLEVIEANAETHEAVEDWRYWAAMGYEF
jgi:hypothetical protein